MKYLVLLPFLLVGCASNNGVDDYCANYEIQVIKNTDSKEAQMQKLEKNTYFQGVCN